MWLWVDLSSQNHQQKMILNMHACNDRFNQGVMKKNKTLRDVLTVGNKLPLQQMIKINTDKHDLLLVCPGTPSHRLLAGPTVPDTNGPSLHLSLHKKKKTIRFQNQKFSSTSFQISRFLFIEIVEGLTSEGARTAGTPYR